jgi:putative salt-induced outer membrane protein YdiY
MKNSLKYIYILSVLTVFSILSGCGRSNVHIEEVQTEYKTVVIENCEYIVYNNYIGNIGYGYMAHKGNCKECNLNKCN